MIQVVALSNAIVVRSGNQILGPITLTISEGERWVILGPNGAGKSTLLKLISTELFPSSGVVEILGNRLGKVDVFEMRTRIGICGSMKHEQIPADETVKDVVITAAYAILGRWNEAYDLWDESRASALLTTFGVRQLGDRKYGTLSDGEKKRVQIARALMIDPELLLLDEPTAGLDLGGREDLLIRFAQFAQDFRAPATVTVTHHIEEIPVGTTHALLMNKGQIYALGPIDQVVTSDRISQLFGVPIVVQKENGRFFART